MTLTFPEEHFRELVRSMRIAQRAYFRDRSTPNLQCALRLEKAVDDELAPKEKGLFSDFEKTHPTQPPPQEPE